MTTIAGKRPRRKRRGKATDAGEPGDAPEVPIRRYTHARAERLGGEDEARDWMEAARRDGPEREGLLADALAVLNETLGAHRLASGEAAAANASTEEAIAIRVGYGTGDEIAAARWREAMELPLPGDSRSRRPRTEDVRPQQRLAAILSGRDVAEPWESHALRAQADLDAGREREAAIEADAAVRAFAASADASNRPERLAGAIAEAESEAPKLAREALGGSLAPERAEVLAAVVEVMGRLQRRRREPRTEP